MATLETQYKNFLKKPDITFEEWKTLNGNRLGVALKNGGMVKPIIYIDMDDTICDFTGAHKRARSRCPEQKYPQAEMDFFRSLKPLPHAIESVKRLDEKFEVLFATRPSDKNPLCYTEKALWIRDHFGQDWVNRLYLVPDKKRLIGDYLIDDKPWDNFQGVQILFGSEEYPDWHKIVFKLHWEIETIK